MKRHLQKPIARLAIIVTVLALLGTGCAHRTAERTISPAQIGESGQTKITGYMSAPLRPGSPSEDTPSSVSRDAVADEAELISLEDDQACISLISRTHIDLDEALAVYEVTLNDEQVYAGEELVSVADWSYSGERTIFAAEGVTSTAFAQMRLTEPEERIYRVVERETEFCGYVGDSPEINLHVVLPQDDNRGSWGQRFNWEFR